MPIWQSTRDKLRYAQELLSHQISPGDVAAALDRVVDLALAQLEKRKFAATDRPRPGHRRSRNPRHIPADVKRAVWERDHGQCTFVTDTGHRCPARTLIQFDHVDEVARGGRATVANLRLRCRAHNQYTAERTFGTEFMRHKRESARAAAAERRAAVGARASTAVATAAAAAEKDPDRDVVPWLRALGFCLDEARRAAAHCDTLTDAPLEERVRAALSCLAGPRRQPKNHSGPLREPLAAQS